MQIVDVLWTPSVNHAVVECDCGGRFGWPMNFDLITCSSCGARAWVDAPGRETWEHLYAKDDIPPVADSWLDPTIGNPESRQPDYSELYEMLWAAPHTH